MTEQECEYCKLKFETLEAYNTHDCTPRPLESWELAWNNNVDIHGCYMDYEWIGEVMWKTGYNQQSTRIKELEAMCEYLIETLNVVNVRSFSDDEMEEIDKALAYYKDFKQKQRADV